MNHEEEIAALKETIENMKQQINVLTNHLMAISPLATPEQKQSAYDMYMSQIQNEAIHEENERAFR